MYTNTGKLSHVVGLVLTTIALSYVTTHATPIVDGTISAAKKGFNALRSKVTKKDAKQYELCHLDADGHVIHTGYKVRI